MKNQAKRESPWLRVATIDYYGEWEVIPRESELSGYMRRERSGKPIRVKWPNGTVTREKLVVRHGVDEVQVDMNGIPDVFKTQTLYVQTVFRGLKVLIPLNHNKIRVQRGGKP